jgi:hypothetical protein
MTECQYCCSEIESTATKCPRCRSYLGRLSWLRNATTEFSVISVLVAVLALSLPAIKSLLPQKSQLVVAILKSEGTSFEFMVSNMGNRPAAITQAGLEFTSTHNGKQISHWTRLEESDFRSSMVEPGKAYRFSADSMSGLPPMQPNPGVSEEVPELMKNMPKKCSLKLVYADFDGSEKIIREPYRCFVN